MSTMGAGRVFQVQTTSRLSDDAVVVVVTFVIAAQNLSEQTKVFWCLLWKLLCMWHL